MLNLSLFPMIFKRKSFHLFRNCGNETLSSTELETIYRAYRGFHPLYPEIRTEIRIVPGCETNCSRGQEYCILFYSEEKENYLMNIGYLGEQLDLFLVSMGIATLWYGIGKVENDSYHDMKYVIMIAIRKVSEPSKFRKDMFKSKRKEISDIWDGTQLERITELVRFAPSACNTQPWFVKNSGTSLSVYRYKDPNKRGIMPKAKITYYNRIDIGIFLYFLDLCLENASIEFEKQLFLDTGTDAEYTHVAQYFWKE